MSALGFEGQLGGLGKPAALVDIDEVLFPFAHAYDRYLVEVRGFGLDPVALSVYDIPAAAGVDHDFLVAAFLNSDFAIVGTPPIEGVSRALSRLAEDFHLVACTSRHAADEGSASREWLARHLPVVGEVIFTRDRRGGSALPKAHFARELDAVFLFDDSGEHFLGLPDRCIGVPVARPGGLPGVPGAGSLLQVVESLTGA